MTEIFKGDFLDDEKLSIRQWVNDNQPKMSQNITIGENEYIIFPEAKSRSGICI